MATRQVKNWQCHCSNGAELHQAHILPLAGWCQHLTLDFLVCEVELPWQLLWGNRINGKKVPYTELP